MASELILSWLAAFSYVEQASLALGKRKYKTDNIKSRYYYYNCMPTYIGTISNVAYFTSLLATSCWIYTKVFKTEELFPTDLKELPKWAGLLLGIQMLSDLAFEIKNSKFPSKLPYYKYYYYQTKETGKRLPFRNSIYLIALIAVTLYYQRIATSISKYSAIFSGILALVIYSYRYPNGNKCGEIEKEIFA